MQREMLEHFIGLSKEHLLLWEDEDLAAYDAVLQRRACLMSELIMMAETVATRIRQIHDNPFRASTTPDELRDINDEIVHLATHIMDIDEKLRQNFQGSTAARKQGPLD